MANCIKCGAIEHPHILEEADGLCAQCYDANDWDDIDPGPTEEDTPPLTDPEGDGDFIYYPNR